MRNDNRMAGSTSMNKALRDRLQANFTAAQVTAFFGSRTDAELQQILDTIKHMTPIQIQAFKRQLGVMYRQQIASRKRVAKGHSDFGKMLVQLGRENRK